MMAPSGIERALESLREGKCVAILDDESREAETDLFFPSIHLQPQDLRTLRTQAGGELYISIANEVAQTFGLPFVGDALSVPGAVEAYPVLQNLGKGVQGMCQGSCSVGLSLDHRSTHTGAPDNERSLTCRRLAELWEDVSHQDPPLTPLQAGKRLGEAFHIPGHIFLCIESKGGLAVRTGHTELSVALARHAGVTPVMVGCVMLSNEGEDYGALPPGKAREWAEKNGVPFLTGRDILAACLTNESATHGGNESYAAEANGSMPNGMASDAH